MSIQFFYKINKELSLIILFSLILLNINIIIEGEEDNYSYHTFDDLSKELTLIEKNFPEIVKLYSIGKTWENRDIFAVKISDNPEINETEPDILFMGGLHAREFISVEMPIYLINYLVNNYNYDSQVTELVNNREIWIVPCVNPDGHVYVENGKDWRKNQRPNDDGSFGVDLNRNFGYKWGTDAHTSNKPSDDTYHGPNPFSEPETRAIRDLVNDLDFVASISFHSHGELVTYPWSYTKNEKTDDNDLQLEIAKDMAYDTGYDVKQASYQYVAHGDSDDWLYANNSVFSYTFELGTSHKPENPIPELEKNLGACLYLADIAGNLNNALLPDWTYIAYMAGDNSLSTQVTDDLNKMKSASSTEEFNIITLADKKNSNTSAYNISSNELVEIPLSTIDSSWDGDLDMTNPKILEIFGKWVVENFPARNYILDIWDHGNGLDYVIMDKDKKMSITDLNYALDNITKKIGKKIDILGFDACSMAMLEVYYEIKDNANYIIGSEKDVPKDGWPYDEVFSYLMNNTKLSHKEIAKKITEIYVEYYSSDESRSSGFSRDRSNGLSVTMSTVDTCRLDELASDINQLAQKLKNKLSTKKGTIENIRKDSQTYDNIRYVDLYDFTNRVKENFTSPEFQLITSNVLEELDNVIVQENHWKHKDGKSVNNAHGLTFYFPKIKESYDDKYESLEFISIVPEWKEFLKEYYDGREGDQYFYYINAKAVDTDKDSTYDTLEISYQIWTSSDTDIVLKVDAIHEDNESEILYNNHSIEKGELIVYAKDFSLEKTGNYNIYVTLYENQKEEDSELFTDIYLEKKSGSYPDIIIESIIIPDLLVEGEIIQFTATIKNIGSNDSKDILVDVIYAYKNIFSTKITELAANQSVNITFNATFPDGQHTIKVIVDSNNMIFEENENNNEIIKTFTLEKAIHVIGIFCGKTQDTLKVNETTEYRINLTNYGNVEETVNISINGTIPEGWKAELSINQIVLKPEEWKIFSFIVTAPIDTEENQTVNFTLDIKAETRNYTVSLSATVLKEELNGTNGDDGFLEGKSYLWVVVGLIVILVVVDVYIVWMRKKKKGVKKK